MSGGGGVLGGGSGGGFGIKGVAVCDGLGICVEGADMDLDMGNGLTGG